MWGKAPPSPQAFPPASSTWSYAKKTQLNQQEKPLWTKENFVEWQGNETRENLIR